MKPFFKRYKRRSIEVDPFFASASAEWGEADSEDWFNYLRRLVALELSGEPDKNLLVFGDLSHSFDGDHLDVVFVPNEGNPDEVAAELMSTGRLEDGIALAEHLVRTQEPHPMRLYNLGLAYSELRRYDEAAIRLGKAVELDPEHSDAWLALATAYYRLGNTPAVEATLRKAVDADPQNARALHTLAVTLFEFGKRAEALDVFRQYLATEPRGLREYLAFAILVADMGSEAAPSDREAALGYIQRVIAQAPDSDLSHAAKDARSRIQSSTRRQQHGETPAQLRMDVIESLELAISIFATLTEDQKNAVVLEAAEIAQHGISVSEVHYDVRALRCDCTGMQLMALLFVGLKEVAPDTDSGIDFGPEYAHLVPGKNQAAS